MDLLTALLSLLQEAVKQLNDFVSTPTGARAIVMGLILGWGLTQFIKFLPVMRRMQDDLKRTVIQLVAFTTTFIPIYLLWPATPTDKYIGPVCAFASALWSPWVYKHIVTILVHQWPWLEPTISATSSITKDEAQQIKQARKDAKSAGDDNDSSP